jgi:hypothetical protein
MFYRAYGFWALLIGLMFSITETLNRCAQPLFLGALLTYFVDPETSKREAYFYASGIVICSLIPALTFHPFVYRIFEIGTNLRIGSSRLVYDKVNSTFAKRKDKLCRICCRFFASQNLPIKTTSVEKRSPYCQTIWENSMKLCSRCMFSGKGRWS